MGEHDGHTINIGVPDSIGAPEQPNAGGQATGPLTVEQLVTKLIHAGFEDRWPSNYGEAVVQVTLDGESFYSLVGPYDYSDGGVVFELAPWPPTPKRPARWIGDGIQMICTRHGEADCGECSDGD